MGKMGKYGRGDNGETYLLTGEKVWKDDPRLEVLGSLDELSSIIGLAKSIIDEEYVCKILETIQEHLFSIGYKIQLEGKDLEDNNEEIKNSLEDLESWVRDYESELPVLKKFIFPGGDESAAILHVARAIARRVERRIITLSKEKPIQSEILAYINRLSTLLFLLARYMNFKKGFKEKEWSREI